MITRTRGRLGEQSTHVGIKNTNIPFDFFLLSSIEDRDGFDVTIGLKDDFTLSGCNSRCNPKKSFMRIKWMSKSIASF
jgi:hypothetical protein